MASLVHGNLETYKTNRFFVNIDYTILFLQLSQSQVNKRPSYDAIEGANVTPTTFYNIGDLEIQDKLARIWYDKHFKILDDGCVCVFLILLLMMLNLHVLMAF